MPSGNAPGGMSHALHRFPALVPGHVQRDAKTVAPPSPGSICEQTVKCAILTSRALSIWLLSPITTKPEEIFPMSCPSCLSSNQAEFPAEINLHFPGSSNWTKPTVWLFPNVLVCFDCGVSRFYNPGQRIGAACTVGRNSNRRGNVNCRTYLEQTVGRVPSVPRFPVWNENFLSGGLNAQLRTISKNKVKLSELWESIGSLVLSRRNSRFTGFVPPSRSWGP